QIEAVQMLVKNNVAGMFGGNRKSKNYGSSCEFADYRDYMPGDDTTKIDWNAYARFDKLYQKLYLDERQMHTRIYIDGSRSMAYGDEKKAEQALKLAAALAYVAVADMDKVSVYVIHGNQVESVFSSVVGKEAFLREVGKLDSVVFDGDSQIGEAILQSKVGYGDGMSVIISDFFTEENYERAIDYLTDKKRHVLCMQVLAKEELKPQARGKMHFYDSEDAEKTYRKNIDREIAKAYKAALEYTVSRIENYCMARGADYVMVAAEHTIAEVFFGKMVDKGVLK
ncbi:MAG: DUF58 domain-containing protein, partial [Clostridia bacterium]|nr:DUF58 domain-containing protein [Clostridia bacterium]